MKHKPEKWNTVLDYGALYFISDRGNVYSARTNRNMRLGLNKDGYLKVDLYKNKVRQTFLVHRLVAMAFLERQEGCDCVNHKDSNRQNNCVQNLEWTTVEQNLIMRCGYNTTEVNIVDADSCKIVAMCRNVTEAAYFAHVSPTTIRNILGTAKSVHGYRFEIGF
jgi:hypothetical protein